MTDLVDAARERMDALSSESWEPREFDELVRLMRKFAEAFEDSPPGDA